jgi:hypothetical protein
MNRHGLGVVSQYIGGFLAGIAADGSISLQGRSVDQAFGRSRGQSEVASHHGSCARASAIPNHATASRASVPALDVLERTGLVCIFTSTSRVGQPAWEQCSGASSLALYDYPMLAREYPIKIALCATATLELAHTKDLQSKAATLRQQDDPSWVSLVFLD